LTEKGDTVKEEFEQACWNLVRIYAEKGEQEKTLQWIERLIIVIDDPVKSSNLPHARQDP